MDYVSKNDFYEIRVASLITNMDRDSLLELYQPIIGHTAVSLYFTLIDDLEKREFMSDELTHHHLVSTMKIKLPDKYYLKF